MPSLLFFGNAKMIYLHYCPLCPGIIFVTFHRCLFCPWKLLKKTTPKSRILLNWRNFPFLLKTANPCLKFGPNTYVGNVLVLCGFYILTRYFRSHYFQCLFFVLLRIATIILTPTHKTRAGGTMYGGHVPLQILADQLTLFQLEVGVQIKPTILSPIISYLPMALSFKLLQTLRASSLSTFTVLVQIMIPFSLCPNILRG